ncbi:MAG: hypothetical protein GF349_03825 [Candidatus Magasanikbacteria bacterium]|nr:hypothetical protein [Candidatus Magasanikbacteria bacterium]
MKLWPNMYLLIDLSKNNKIKLKLFDIKGKITSEDYNAKNRDLLVSLDTFFIQNLVKVKQIKGIAVVVGEGSFTSTRIATTVANVFCYVHGIKVIGVNVEIVDNYPELISIFDNTEKSNYVSASYSGKPNIG